ncbi:MAG: TIGR03936 family radical SAM-associated protein [Sciscionella sp.]
MDRLNLGVARSGLIPRSLGAAMVEPTKGAGVPVPDDRPNPSAAPVCKVRLRFAKRGRLRFASHRDVARVFERALRRSGVPMAYSQGFSPHPKISWLGAAPTGTASEAEYVELALVREVDLESLRDALNAGLPADLRVMEVLRAQGGALAERLTASEWRIGLPGVSPQALRAAVEALRGRSEVLVQRRTKSGLREVDVRSALRSMAVFAQLEGDPIDVGELTLPPIAAARGDHRGRYGILVVVIRHSTPTVRPDDVLSALRIVAELDVPAPAKAVRWAQGRLDEAGRIVDPLDPDRVR